MRIFHHLGEFTNLLSTTKFSFDGKQVSIVASEEYAQRYIDQFKEWLKKANHEYEQNTPPREAGSRRKKRTQLQLEKETEERRLRLLKNLEF